MIGISALHTKFIDETRQFDGLPLVDELVGLLGDELGDGVDNVLVLAEVVVVRGVVVVLAAVGVVLVVGVRVRGAGVVREWLA